MENIKPPPGELKTGRNSYWGVSYFDQSSAVCSAHFSKEGRGAFTLRCSHRNPAAGSKWRSEARPSCSHESILFHLMAVSAQIPHAHPHRAGWAPEKCWEQNWPRGAADFTAELLGASILKISLPPISVLALHTRIMCQHVLRQSSLHHPWSNPCLLLVLFAVTFSGVIGHIL